MALTVYSLNKEARTDVHTWKHRHANLYDFVDVHKIVYTPFCVYIVFRVINEVTHFHPILKLLVGI